MSAREEPRTALSVLSEVCDALGMKRQTAEDSVLWRDAVDALVAEAKAEERGAIFAEIRRDPDNALDVICWLERKADRCRT